MRTLIARNLKRLVRETRGAEIAETAVVLPLLFTMLLAVFWFSQAFSTYGAITRAAQAGARAGAAPECSTCAGGATPSQNAYAAVQSALLGAKLDPAKAQFPVPAPTLYICSDPTNTQQRNCSLSPTNVCVQDSIKLSQSSAGSGGAGVCGISVSFRYPYQFRLPFMSLDNRLIYLPAQARMRSETR